MVRKKTNKVGANHPSSHHNIFTLLLHPSLHHHNYFFIPLLLARSPMAIPSSPPALILPFIVLLLPLSASTAPASGIGINYGQIANNLPSHAYVASLLKSLNITKVKLYDADPNVLKAFASSGVEFTVAIPNEQLSTVTDTSSALSWLKTNLLPYITSTNITTINVGNEVFSTQSNSQYSSLLIPALRSVYSAVAAAGLSNKLTVTTSHSLSILSTSFPPSAGAFNPAIADSMRQLLTFLSQSSSPLLINAYPFFAYKDDPHQVSLSYTLFQPNSGTVDGGSGLSYDNMLYAQVDAVYAAMAGLGFRGVEVKVSETGWPSKGDEGEAGASVENAAMYNGGLVRRVTKGEGTPGRPSSPIDVYLFALFNEDMKPGPGSERNYGLYYPDGRPVYSVGLQQTSSSSFLQVASSSGSSTNAAYSCWMLCLFAAILCWLRRAF